MGADVSALEGLAAGLAAARTEVLRAVRPVVARGALNIKNDWRANASISGGPHTPYYPASISYDTTVGATGASAVIGPDKGRRQGALGNLLEFGSVHNPPHNDGGRALDSEDPRFVAAVGVAAQAAVDAAVHG